MDWRTIDYSTEAGLLQLSVVICQRLGWTVYHHEHGYLLLAPREGGYSDEACAYLATTAGGGNAATERGAWEWCTNYAEDANEALALPIGDNYLFLTRSPEAGWIARIVDPEGNTYDDCKTWKATAPTPALAICLVWLEWKDQ